MPSALNRTVDNVVDLIFGEFDVWWGTTNSRSEPIAWPNMAFDPKDSAAADGWIRVSLVHIPGASGQQTLGNNPVFRRQASFVVQVFVPAGQGRGGADDMAEIVMQFIETEGQDSNVWFRNQGLTEVGIDDNGWYQINCEADLIYDIIRNL